MEGLNLSPMTVSRATELGLIDKSMYRDEVLDMVQSSGENEKLPRVTLGDYVKAVEREELERVKNKKRTEVWVVIRR